jgi:hypothetical protein
MAGRDEGLTLTGPSLKGRVKLVISKHVSTVIEESVKKQSV